MKKILLWIVIALGILTSSLLYLGPRYSFTVTNYVVAIGYLFVSASAILVYFQIRINLRYNKRKAAVEFIFTKIQNELKPKIEELEVMLGIEDPIFIKIDSFSEILKKRNFNDEDTKKMKALVRYILNFYERMAIAIAKETFDGDICYDDTGFILINFYHWVRSYVWEKQQSIEDRAYANFEVIALKWMKDYERMSTKNVRSATKEKQRKTVKNKGL